MDYFPSYKCLFLRLYRGFTATRRYISGDMKYMVDDHRCSSWNHTETFCLQNDAGYCQRTHDYSRYYISLSRESIG